ncbi:hypothetical protein V8G54_025127 [Vigna mungo]|uniref:Uncharacterized protein n=1 Tax=Vigna mungo TaxID=3915 RepID=A0AAQ3RU24_VIGMU
MEMGNVNDERGLGAKSFFLFIIFSPPNYIERTLSSFTSMHLMGHHILVHPYLYTHTLLQLFYTIKNTHSFSQYFYFRYYSQISIKNYGERGIQKYIPDIRTYACLYIQ